MNLFDLAAKRNDEIVKEAFGAYTLMSGLGRGALRVAKSIGTSVARKPLQTVSTALAADEVFTGARKGMDAVATGRNIGTSNVAP